MVNDSCQVSWRFWLGNNPDWCAVARPLRLKKHTIYRQIRFIQHMSNHSLTSQHNVRAYDMKLGIQIVLRGVVVSKLHVSLHVVSIVGLLNVGTKY